MIAVFIEYIFSVIFVRIMLFYGYLKDIFDTNNIGLLNDCRRLDNFTSI